jgi:hypothetical protein
MIDEAAIRLRWDAVGSRLDERGRRLFAAAEVRSSGRGGLVIVSKITGLAAILNGTTQLGHGSGQNRSSYCSECPNRRGPRRLRRVCDDDCRNDREIVHTGQSSAD